MFASRPTSPRRVDTVVNSQAVRQLPRDHGRAAPAPTEICVPHGKRPISNRLLSALPRRDRERVLSRCAEVELVFGQVLYEQGDAVTQVYFPLDSFISLLTPGEGHASLEVGLVGNEGMLGVSLVLGVDATSMRGLVQGTGTALRLDAQIFQEELERCGQLRWHLNRYIYVLMNQFAQSTACTRFHVLVARLARWLLMTHDRAHADQFHVTHEFLSYMLGVRRVGVTNAAGMLQRQGLISYRRGDITVLDRPGLEAAACSCYREDITIYERMLGPPPPASLATRRQLPRELRVSGERA